jgi:DNA-binding SARP family transcriptional activator
MQTAIDHKPKIEIKMLGEFSLSINGNKTANLKGRTKRVWMLIEYLIANRKKDVSLDMLIKILWEEDECSNPLNALKNLVYRARELLKEIANDENAEFITFMRNTYSWNNKYDCVIDTEQLEECWNSINDPLNSEEERIHSCERALTLYQGDFLPKSTYSTWVVSLGAYYSTLYNECVVSGCELLMGNFKFDKVIHICETALIYSPFEESIHKLLMNAYISTNQRSKAMSHYSDTVKLFHKELGVQVSDSMNSIYRQLIHTGKHSGMDIGKIKKDLREPMGSKGAYFCDYEVFKSFYQIQARMMIRTGISLFIVLFSLCDLNGEPVKQEAAQQAGSRLRDAILFSLRRGDTVTSYNTNQYIVLLHVSDYESVEKIANRILKKFRMLYGSSNIKLVTRINALDAVK